MSGSTLTLENVSATIAEIPVLRGIHAEVRAGSTLAIVGRNGAGKTTLLRLIMGLVAVRAGRVLFDGLDVAKVLPYDRPRLGIGYAPEDRVLFPTFTVGENLRFPCQVQRMDNLDIDRRLDEVLAIVPELAPMLARSASALSGGQGKIAVLGRALMIGTRLVMLDEPFQGLAPALAAQYSASLQRLQAARPELAIIITESNERLLKGLAGSTLTLERGALAPVILESKMQTS
jgi:ABC-type branched-subunit amino acid transport system ATPase component